MGVTVAANGRLQAVNRARVKEMGFPIFAVLVTAAHRQRLAVDRPFGEGVAVAEWPLRRPARPAPPPQCGKACR
jgi:hypothetical protein